MSEHTNSFNQRVGKPVIDWSTVDPPSGKPMEGSYCRVESLNVERHLNDLFDAFSDDAEGRLWTCMFVGPFDSIGDFRDWMISACNSDDPLFHALTIAILARRQSAWDLHMMDCSGRPWFTRVAIAILPGIR